MQRTPALITGLLLLTVCSIGAVHAVRATTAFTIYYHTKYGKHALTPEAAAARCASAHRLYSFNYHFCIWTAEHAWYNRFLPDGVESPERVDLARTWCDIGLSLNPWKSQLRLLQTRLLRRISPQAALDYWRVYVDWYFWNSYHHAVLAELYAETGDFASAIAELTWIRGRELREQARKQIKAAWEAESAFPPARPAPRP